MISEKEKKTRLSSFIFPFIMYLLKRVYLLGDPGDDVHSIIGTFLRARRERVSLTSLSKGMP